MVKTLVKGSILGGLTLFVWGMISWMALPWHNAALGMFENEKAVGRTLKANAGESGVYLLPCPHPDDPGATPDAKRERMERAHALMKKGPVAFVAFTREGVDPANMGRMMFRGFLIQALAALGLTWLLLQAGALSYRGRVGFTVAVGLVAGVLCHLPYWNWWGFSRVWTSTMVADLAVGNALAGFVLAWVTAPKRRRRR